MQKRRIEYIDALRGFTMILVVFAHIETFTLNIPPNSTLLSSVFISFRMPLFFFISGFLTYKYSTCIGGGKSLIRNSLKKIRIQLIPTAIIGLIYTYTICNGNVYAFLNNTSKYGYWFTIVLLQMFLIYYIICYVTRKQTINKNFKPLLITMIVTAIFIYILLSPIKRFPELDYWCGITSFTYTCNYFIYFIFGIISSIYKVQLQKALNNQYITATIIITFLYLVYIQFTITAHNSYIVEKLFARVIPIVLGISGILLVFNYFKTNQEYFTKEAKLGKVLQYIGKRTLDIYLLHYFFLPVIPSIGNYIKDKPNMIIEFFVGVTLSIAVIGVCLIVSNILRTSKFLGFYLFGAKRE